MSAGSSGLIERLLARCTFPAEGRVDCAVSGGPDSLALLVLACGAGLDVTAWHVDHRLRPDSDRDAAVVEAAANRFGADVKLVTSAVPPGSNLEARARTARFAALPHGVLTGHTADDQAETVLLALMRGAGLNGLAAMRPRGHPLLGLRRSDTEAVCAEVGVEPVRDPTNASPVHRRNRVRHELIPLLDDVAERDVVAVIARQCRHLADDADLLDRLASELDVSNAAELSAAPVALARRAVRRWLTVEHPPDTAAVDRVLAVASGEARATEVGGRRVWRSQGRLHADSVPGAGTGGPVSC